MEDCEVLRVLMISRAGVPSIDDCEINFLIGDGTSVLPNGRPNFCCSMIVVYSNSDASQPESSLAREPSEAHPSISTHPHLVSAAPLNASWPYEFDYKFYMVVP